MYRWVEHMGEVELEIEAETERQVFADALAALVDLLAIGGGAEEPRVIEVSASDRPALLAAWLEELIFLLDVHGFEPIALQDLEVGADSLRAVVIGHVGNPSPLVKAVTYHRLSFERAGRGYRATVVLDV
jgi:SHS2 domain-containing protein